MQATLDSFQINSCIPQPVNNNPILVAILQDFNVAWYDRDWHFHKQDIAHVPGELAALLVERGIARKITTQREEYACQ